MEFHINKDSIASFFRCRLQTIGFYFQALQNNFLILCAKSAIIDHLMLSKQQMMMNEKE
jgi:hypothetical protein